MTGLCWAWPAMFSAWLAAYVFVTPAWAFFTSLPGVLFLTICMSKQGDATSRGAFVLSSVSALMKCCRHGPKETIYHFFVSKSGQPLRLHMHGQDLFSGSHFGEARCVHCAGLPLLKNACRGQALETNTQSLGCNSLPALAADSRPAVWVSAICRLHCLVCCRSWFRLVLW